MHSRHPFSDSHAHLSKVGERLGGPFLESVLTRYANDSSVPSSSPAETLILDVGIVADDLGGRAALLASYPFIRLSAGIWPSREALERPSEQLALLERSIRDAGGASAIAAIGEGGLDYFHMNGRKEAQRELFVRQLDLARRLAKPFIVHSRDAAADTIDILRSESPSVPVVIHCFGYGPAEAKAFLDLGCYVSFAGNLSYKNSGLLREACASLPAGRLLLETDSPYLNPEPHRGRPSSPLDIERCYQVAAGLRGITVEELAFQVGSTTANLFGTGISRSLRP